MRLKKWEWLIIAGVIAVCFGIAWAVDEQLTIGFPSKTLTAASYTTANRAILYVETNDIRVTMDGVSVPTSAGVGLLIKKDAIYYDLLTTNKAIKNFKAVRASGSDAKITLSYQWDDTRVQ